MFQQLEGPWLQLDQGVRREIFSEWDSTFQRLLSDLKAPCVTCDEAASFDVQSCVTCRGKLSANSMQLERWVDDFATKLRCGVYFPK